MRKFILFICFTMILISCSTESDLIGVWKLSRIEDPSITKALNDLNNSRPNILMDFDYKMTYSYLNLCDNNEFAYLTNGFYFVGKWTYNTDLKNISLKIKDSKDENIITFNIKEFSKNDSLVLTLKPIKQKDTLSSDFMKVWISTELIKSFRNDSVFCVFNIDNFKYDDVNKNIYSFKNNSWRIKPLKVESKIQIKERLKSNLNFAILYLNNSLIREDASIDISPIILPIKLAGNGIALYKIDNLPLTWISLFYNESQANEAYHILADAYKDLHTGDYEKWIELDIDLLKQIYDKIK
jgi:hypothetical protein